MIYSVTFSKPTSLVKEKFGREYIRVKIRMTNETSDDKKYFAEFFTEKQSFHEHFSTSQLDNFISENAGKVFKNCVVFTETEEITTMASKKGKITRLVKKIKSSGEKILLGNNRQKKYILKEGDVVPFLVELGVMSREGKVIAAKYDKFRQINRFLEFINDILPELVAETTDNSANDASKNGTLAATNRPLRIVDFGSGKSYLTFATHYFLTEIKKLQVEIVGLDLKKDVIANCTTLAEKLGCAGLSFQVGDIACYSVANENDAPDLMISLHACDTATDYALAFAIKHKCKAILSVPCCQHEINKQLEKNFSRSRLAKGENASASKIDLPARTHNSSASKKTPPEFEALLKYGILRERFAALATDALRAEYLEEAGYNVQLLEFIDMEHTPKNILIRAVRRKSPAKKSGATSEKNLPPASETSTSESHSLAENLPAGELTKALQLEPTLGKLISN